MRRYVDRLFNAYCAHNADKNDPDATFPQFHETLKAMPPSRLMPGDGDIVVTS